MRKVSLAIPLFLIISMLFIAGCRASDARSATPSNAAPTHSPVPILVTATNTRSATAGSSVPAATRTPRRDMTQGGPTNTPLPASWQDWPIVPEVSQGIIDLYWQGIEAGRNPHAFALAGDCNSQAGIYLAPFDQNQYDLGEEYAYLQPTIEHFAGYFSMIRASAMDGFNVASVQSELFANPNWCEMGETPLECEFRLKNPSIIIISLGTNYEGVSGDKRRGYYEQIVEYALNHQVIPILATKADNLEGDHSINQMIVDIAIQYDVPVWNFWRAAQELPGGGIELSDSGKLYSLTYGYNWFEDPAAMQAGWPWRNLTALQALHAVHTAVMQQEPIGASE